MKTIVVSLNYLVHARVGVKGGSMQVKLVAENIRENTAKNIRATILQIEAARIAEQADKANEVAKIREEYGQLLNALSLAFESSQVFADQLGQKLFDPNAVPAGSVVNILL